jgi:hypothetical protein
MTDAPAPAVQPSYAPAPRTNGLAIASFVLGILGFAIIPVILGHISISQINKRGEGGKVFAIIGLVLGYLGILAWVLFFLIFLPLIFVAGATGS